MTDWRPSAKLEALKARASLYRHIHAFFSARRVLQVDTPALAQHGVTDINIHSIAVPGYGYLQPSPEYHMKRLLAAGSGAIYQISKAFRDGEAGSRHNPEFTLLEWYRPDFSLQQLINETIALLQPLLSVEVYQTTFRALFLSQLGIDPLLTDTQTLQKCADNIEAVPQMNKAALIDWLMACVIEPALPKDRITVVTDFPSWAAALAKKKYDEDGEEVAQRFEIYAGGYELANGYCELTDATEQARRFAQDIDTRNAEALPAMSADTRLIAAMQHGLPSCSGVAVGVERLLMAQHGWLKISDALAFPTTIA
jgi:elongation factor P--(R)-beta-lysine ligase